VGQLVPRVIRFLLRLVLGHRLGLIDRWVLRVVAGGLLRLFDRRQLGQHLGFVPERRLQRIDFGDRWQRLDAVGRRLFGVDRWFERLGLVLDQPDLIPS
jgi:hypothetical protein